MSMNKRILSALPLQKATAGICNLITRVSDETIFLSAEIKLLGHRKTLVLSFFLHKDLLQSRLYPAFRTFICHNDYITEDFRMDYPQWRTSCFKNLGLTWNWYKYIICADSHSETAIRKFTKSSHQDLMRALIEWQQKIMDKRLEKKHQKIKARIDAHMRLIRPIPSKFVRWADKDALPESRYIFYQYKKGCSKLQGHCSHCGQNVEINSPRYNQQGVCPSCGKTVVYKSVKKCGSFIDRGGITLLQKAGSGLFLRYFEIYKKYDPQKNCFGRLTYHEISRTLYRDGQIYDYEWGNFKQTGECRWCDPVSTRLLPFFPGTVYLGNIRQATSGTPWQYAAISEYVQSLNPSEKFDIYQYIRVFQKYPFIEYLVKLGMKKMTDDFLTSFVLSVSINEQERSIWKILNISRPSLHLLRKKNAGIDMLRLVQKMEQVHFPIHSAAFQRYISYFGTNSSVAENVQYATFHKIMKYLQQQSQPNRRLYDVSCNWADYVKFCKELGYDLHNEFLLFPRNLWEAHDLASQRVRALRDAIHKQKLKELQISSIVHFENVQKTYGWEKDDYLIRAPKDMNEIIEEGHQMHHCVGNYAERAAKGETNILFLRRKEESNKPFYTIEVKNNKVVQCQGKFHASMTPEIEKLIREFSTQKLKGERRRRQNKSRRAA